MLLKNFITTVQYIKILTYMCFLNCLINTIQPLLWPPTITLFTTGNSLSYFTIFLLHPLLDTSSFLFLSLSLSLFLPFYFPCYSLFFFSISHNSLFLLHSLNSHFCFPSVVALCLTNLVVVMTKLGEKGSTALYPSDQLIIRTRSSMI